MATLFAGGIIRNLFQKKKAGRLTTERDAFKRSTEAATAEKVAADEDLRRQRLFQKPVTAEDDEEILSKRKQLLGQ